jgi:hypothetical protein
MPALCLLVVAAWLLTMGEALASNFNDQWSPNKRNFWKPNSPGEVIIAGGFAVVISIVLAAATFFAGLLVHSADWGYAWATAALILFCLYQAKQIWDAIRGGLQYKHPDNPKGSFWP